MFFIFSFSQFFLFSVFLEKSVSFFLFSSKYMPLPAFTHLGESIIQLVRVGWRLLACEKTELPQIGLMFVCLFVCLSVCLFVAGSNNPALSQCANPRISTCHQAHRQEPSSFQSCCLMKFFRRVLHMFVKDQQGGNRTCASRVGPLVLPGATKDRD